MYAVRSLSAHKAGITISAISVATALLVSGCGATQSPSSQPGISQASNTDDYVQVCQDKDTQQRVEDNKCDGNLTGTHYQPSYYHYSSMIPAIGAGMLAGYLLSAPARSNVYRGAAPTTGGYAPVTRPNSGFLKVPDDFVAGAPVVPPAPSTAPRVPSTTPDVATKATAAPPQKKSTDDKNTTKKGTDTTTKKAPSIKMPSTRRR